MFVFGDESTQHQHAVDAALSKEEQEEYEKDAAIHSQDAHQAVVEAEQLAAAGDNGVDIWHSGKGGDPWQRQTHGYPPGSPEDRAMAKKGWWKSDEWDSWQQYDKAQWDAASWQSKGDSGAGDPGACSSKEETFIMQLPEPPPASSPASTQAPKRAKGDSVPSHRGHGTIAASSEPKRKTGGRRSQSPPATPPHLLSANTSQPVRSRSSPPHSKESHHDASECDFASMLAQFKGEIQNTLSGQVEKLVGSLHRNMAQQFTAHEERMSRQDVSINHLSKDVQELQSEVRELRTSLATDAVTDPTVDPSYDRSPDYRLLQLNSTTPLSASDFKQIITTWLAEDFKGDQWEAILDDSQGKIKNATVRFKGPADGTAARRAEKARQLCRTSGKWEPLRGVGDVRVFVNQDKSKKQSKVEWASRRLKKILASELSGFKSTVYVSEGFARVDEIDCINIEVGGPNTTPTLLWNNKAVEELGIDKKKICDAFAKAVATGARSREDIMWSG
mmetsp:Transcript_90590/g.157241  ORF Transcript_90590/g.157241 Transcript_90590/m.157241 type:complete len:503 (+) Transcript_90590:369-1877(+)